MQKLVAGLAFVASAVVAFGQGVILEAGQSYTFEFTSLPYVRPAETESGSLAAYFGPGFTDGERVRLEVFPNTLSDSPRTSLFTQSGPGSPSSLVLGQLWRSSDPPFFLDLQGIARVTMLSGDAQLDGFAVQQVISGGVYSQYFAVPEPSAGLLLAVGLCAIWARRRRRGMRNPARLK